jgi:hypothetical protein
MRASAFDQTWSFDGISLPGLRRRPNGPLNAAAFRVLSVEQEI